MSHLDRDTPSIESQSRNMTIIWGALIASLFAYLMVLYFTLEAGDIPSDEDLELVGLLTKIFLAVAVLEVFAIFWLRRNFSRKVTNRKFASPHQVQNNYFTLGLIVWSLAEGIAIYGFILSLLAIDLFYFLAFAAPALLVMLATPPRLRAVMDDYERSGDMPEEVTPPSSQQSTDDEDFESDEIW